MKTAHYRNVVSCISIIPFSSNTICYWGGGVLRCTQGASVYQLCVLVYTFTLFFQKLIKSVYDHYYYHFQFLKKLKLKTHIFFIV